MSAVAESNTLSGLGLRSELLQFVGALWEIDIVQRVSFSQSNETLLVWVWFKEERDEEIERAMFAECELRRTLGQPALDVRYMTLPKIDVHHLPPSRTIFERS